VPGIYLAGVIVAGARTSEIFIENGRFHGRQIAAALVSKAMPRDEAHDALAASDSL
jgi:thioredoxin reductase (NADPH)